MLNFASKEIKNEIIKRITIRFQTMDETLSCKKAANEMKIKSEK